MNQRAGPLFSKRRGGGGESRKMMRVKGMFYGEGNFDAAIGDGVSGWGLRIPKEKASIVGYEDPISMQEDAGLVEETIDTIGSGSAAVDRKDGKLIFGGGRRPVVGLGNL